MKRTFSEFGRFSTGLPALQAHEAGCQDFSNFGKALGRVPVMKDFSRHDRRMSQNDRMSSVRNELADLVVVGGRRLQTNVDRSCAKLIPVRQNLLPREKIDPHDSEGAGRSRAQCGVVLDYVPWPESGCSLAEARRRTLGCVLQTRRSELTSQLDHVRGDIRDKPTFELEIGSADENIGTPCLEHLKAKRLIAYGRLGRPAARLQLVSAVQWSVLTNIDWENSSAGEDRPGGLAFFDITVYPPLLAPCRIDLLAGCPLADVFKGFVLGDPEVAALGKKAVRLSPRVEGVFVHGRCHVDGFAEWPLAFDRWSMVGIVHPDPAKRSKFSVNRKPDPIEVVVATEALIVRYRALISMLRRGELDGRGLPAASQHSEVILRSIWSHDEFHFDARNGDILQDNPDSSDRYDRLIKRWIGVVLQKPAGVISQETVSPDGRIGGLQASPDAKVEFTTCSDETITFDGFGMPEPEQAIANPLPRARALEAVQTRSDSRKACIDWLVDLIRGSPKERTASKSELWKQAREKWPKTLSHRAFLAAREDAIRLTSAAVWAAAGAPKKSQRRNRRTR